MSQAPSRSQRSGAPVSVLAVALLLACGPAGQTSSRIALDFNAGWRFHLGDEPSASDVAYDDSGWRSLDLPHDWSIEGPFAEENPAGAGGGALPGGIGWYRKTFEVQSSVRGRLVFVEFNGVYRNGEVWINDEYLGKRPYGYSSFAYELTPYLRFGGADNVIAVRVDNSEQPNSRWYSGSGIYRHVRLVETDSVRIAHWGTYITTPEVTAAGARVRIRTTLRNASGRTRPITLRTVLYDADGTEVAAASSNGELPADSASEIAQELSVATPMLWSPDTPYLYRAEFRVECDGRLCDDDAADVGLRSFSFEPDRGFILNGARVEIRGVNLHHDLGALGAALNERALERQLEIMKAMGANAIRTSHNPPAPELLDLTDRMGFIVLDEAFDGWRMAKTRFDYHLDWDEWHARDIADMVRRDRNHPSIFIWSIGNEVREQGDSSGITIARELAAIVRGLDPTRPVAAGLDQLGNWNDVIRSGALDIIGYNYRSHLWAAFPDSFPGRVFVATEAASALNTRGYYEQPSDSIARYGMGWVPGPDPNPDYRLSAYDNRAAAWGETHEEALRAIRAGDYLSGMFVWTGFDYLGEPTPYGWPARSSYFGIVDLAGLPKDAYWLYQSQWTDEPVLHVFPHWNWAPGDTIDVWAYTNADAVELFLNGVSLGVRDNSDDVFHLMWRVPFESGVLRAVGRKDGREMAVDEVRTSGPAARVELVADRMAIVADGRDLAFVTVRIVDANGVLVPESDNEVRFRLEGNAGIAGVDNGDPISHAPFQADHVQAFYGQALVIVRAKARPGTLTLNATADGLESASMRIEMEASGVTRPRRQ